MRRRKLLYGLGASSAVLVPSGLTAAAYNSFSVDRSATIDVVADSSGLLQLAPDPDSNIVGTNNGKLSIDITNTTAAGVNQDATLLVGADTDNSEDPTKNYAFSITNNDGSSHDIGASYGSVTADGSGNPNVVFELFDDAGSSEGTVDEEGGGTYSATSLSSGGTLYVLLKVDTTGSVTSDDLSGTLTLTAN